MIYLFKEKYGWTGKVIIEKIRDNKIVSKKTIYNLITNLALNEIVKSLYYEPDMKLRYLAIGDDNTPAAASDEQLGNEIFRTPIISQTITGTGEVTSRAIILDTEPFAAVPPPVGFQCNIKEIGFFGGTSATSTIGTGTLISRIVLSPLEAKYDNEQIAFTRVDTIERG
jgi:hypothetical protein